MTGVAIPKAPNRLRAWASAVLPAVVADAEPSRHARRVDLALYAGATLIGAAALADTWSTHPSWLRPIAIVVGIASVVALRWRRTHPGRVGIGIGIASLVILPVSGAALAATFNAAIRCRGRELAIVAGLGLVWAFLNPLLYPPKDYWFDVGCSLAFAAILFGWGFFIRARRALVFTMTQQTQRAGDEARAAERRRIAREMHDVLAHRLSLLSVHAGALEFHSGASQAEVSAGAGVIRENARIALEELRGVIGVLREDGSETFTEPPQPTLSDISDLVEESRAAGMRVSAAIDLGDADPPAATGRTAYRIVQEGLTNARKHAPGATVTLTIDAVAGAFRIVVRSLEPVAVSAAAMAMPGAGTGLIGLAERVSLAGGTLEHGVDPDGAFILRAKLPR
jgi:signal transduction histidine kinase